MSWLARRLLATTLSALATAGASTACVSAPPLPPPAAGAAKATPGSSPSVAASEGPSLVLFLVFDGLGYEALEKWRGHFGPGGFRRLLEGGAVFDAARYPYVPTFTCPGHATLSTGSLPERHGIVANTWFDRESGAKVDCIQDPSSPPLDEPEGAGVSSRRLRVPTLADQLVATHGASSRVLAISLKERAAAMLAGRKGLSLWWGREGFTTSRAYAERLPAYVQAWNEQRPRLEGSSWERCAAPEVYRGLGKDDDARERPPEELGRTFPHPLKTADSFLYTPSGADQLFDFALSALREERLGLRPGAHDLLAIGVSTMDLVGHAYGPESHEAADTLLRLDRALASFLEGVDRTVGLSRVLIAVTADHGMTPIPLVPEGRLEAAQVTRTAEQALDAAFGEAEWVMSFTTPHLYLRRDSLERRGVSLEAAVSTCRKALLALPGLADVVTPSDMATREPRPLAAGVRAGFLPARSGDLILVPAPNVLLAPNHAHASTHGTPYEPDMHVPLILFGQTVRAARHERPVSPADLAPTLAAWLGVALPDASGTPLREAMP